MTSDELSRAIDELYRAAIGDLAWDQVLDSVLRATGFDGALFYVWDRRQSIRRAASIDPGSSFPISGRWHRLDPALQADYERHFFRVDPRLGYSWRNPGRRIIPDYLHTQEAEIDRSEYYAWFQRQTGMRYSLGGGTRRDLPFGGALSLHRAGRHGHADQGEVARFGMLFDHAERALMVAHRLTLGAARNGGSGELLERNPDGVVLLDRQGGVVYANPAVRAMAARHDAFELGAAGLKALRPGDDQRLQQLIRAAGSTAAGLGWSSGGVLRLARRSGKRDYAVVVAPATSGGLFGFAGPAVSVLIADPERVAELPGAALRRLYGLSAAEARLALGLLAGESLEQVAARFGIATPTARTQLAAVFRKTETGRQTELIRLLAGLAWPIATGLGDPGPE